MHCSALYMLIFITTFIRLILLLSTCYWLRKWCTKKLSKVLLHCLPKRLCHLHPYILFPHFHQECLAKISNLGITDTQTGKEKEGKMKTLKHHLPMSICHKGGRKVTQMAFSNMLFSKEKGCEFQSGKCWQSLTGSVEGRPDFANFSSDIITHGVARAIHRACKNWFQYVNCNWKKKLSY